MATPPPGARQGAETAGGTAAGTTPAAVSPAPPGPLGRVLRSESVRNWLFQILLVGGFVWVLAWIAGNTVTNLAARGIAVGFDFLGRPARFPISESVLPYATTDTFLWAFTVGVVNTLFISVVTIVLATLLGLVVGLARRSVHPLVSRIAGAFVTIMRNVPLIVQLLFWYAIATATFPSPRDALSPMAGVFATSRGVYLPSLGIDPAWIDPLVGLACGAAVALWLRARHESAWLGFGIAAGVAGTILSVWTLGHYELSVPELTGLNFRGGFQLSPEFVALVFGLVLYTSAFIGEIIRGGIDAVRKGQWEASAALGLSKRQALRKVVVPQALRIIIPPMTSQYLSTVKNTTLALAVGYPELGLVVGTVINQTGQAIESILVMLAVFLSISVSVSLLMNWYNARVALVSR